MITQNVSTSLHFKNDLITPTEHQSLRPWCADHLTADVSLNTHTEVFRGFESHWFLSYFPAKLHGLQKWQVAPAALPKIRERSCAAFSIQAKYQTVWLSRNTPEDIQRDSNFLWPFKNSPEVSPEWHLHTAGEKVPSPYALRSGLQPIKICCCAATPSTGLDPACYQRLQVR